MRTYCITHRRGNHIHWETGSCMAGSGEWWDHNHADYQYSMGPQGPFSVCSQPMRDNVTLLCHFSLAGHMYKMISGPMEWHTLEIDLNISYEVNVNHHVSNGLCCPLWFHLVASALLLVDDIQICIWFLILPQDCNRFSRCFFWVEVERNLSHSNNQYDACLKLGIYRTCTEWFCIFHKLSNPHNFLSIM